MSVESVNVRFYLTVVNPQDFQLFTYCWDSIDGVNHKHAASNLADTIL